MASALRISLVGLVPILALIGCNTAPPVQDPVGLEDVVELHEVGSSSTAIANVARNRGLGFPLNVDNILWLREQGVPNPSIEGLIEVERELRELSYRERPRVSLGLGFGYSGGYYRHRYRGRGWRW